MKIFGRTFIALLLAPIILAACDRFRSAPTISPTAGMEIAIPTVSPAAAETQIVYYYFVDTAENPHPAGSVVIMPDTYILAPTFLDSPYGPDTAADLKTALEAVLKDDRNGWISSSLEIVAVTFADGHTDVVLQGEYFGVGDVTLIAARMQILMTVFAHAAVRTAAVTLNGDTIGNLGVSNSMHAKPADYVFTRAEIETFMNEHVSVAGCLKSHTACNLAKTASFNNRWASLENGQWRLP